MTELEYATFCRPYDRALQKLCLDFQFFREDLQGINILAVTSRIKTLASASLKESTTGVLLREMQDIAGMRVIVSTEMEVDAVLSYFQTQAGFNAFVIADDREVHKDGYKARHLVLDFGWTVTLPLTAKVEVQIATSLQHSFNAISRAWVYKPVSKPSRSWEKRFKKVSKALAEIDRQISDLQHELIRAASETTNDEPLTAFSYQEIVQTVFSEHVTINDAVDAVRWLCHLGCQTNGALRNFFRTERVNAILIEWLELSEKGNGSAKVFADLPKHTFFVWWATRGDGTESMLRHAQQSQRHGKLEMTDSEGAERLHRD